MSLSDYSEALLLDALLAEMPFYVALSTADPGDDGSTIAEPADAAYARIESSDFSRTDNTISNTVAVTFVASSASWGTITHFALLDAITDGNILGSGALSPSATVGAGDIAQFAIGALTITLD